MSLILASKSPRRRDILEALGLTFTVLTAPTDETLPEGICPREGVCLLARRKGAAVVPLCPSDATVLSSDTLVELDGEPLGKPQDEAQACAMLRRLSGRAHNVHTGIAVHRTGQVFSDVATTRVYFRPLSEEQIAAYVASGEPMDKAGAYGIQGAAGAFVERIEGDMDTVIGLSSRLTLRLLREAGWEVAR